MSLLIPDLDDKTFDDLFAAARSKIPAYAPKWTDHNYSDPGITVLDLFAWLTEMQMYNTNRITPQLKRKYLKYLNALPEPVIPAIVPVTFTKIEKGTPVKVNTDTVVTAKDPLTDQKEYFECVEEIEVSDALLKHIYYSYNDLWKYYPIESMYKPGAYFEPFYESKPVKGTMYLGIESGNATDQLHLYINLVEDDLPQYIPENIANVQNQSVHLTWQIWNGTEWQTIQVDDRTNGLAKSGLCVLTGMEKAVEENFSKLTDVKKRPDTDPLFWVRVFVQNIKGEFYEIVPQVNAIQLNTVMAQHRIIVSNEENESTGLPLQYITFNKTPVLKNTVNVSINNTIWTEVVDFDNSSPDDYHFVVDYEKSALQFGDGEYGYIPPEGEKIVVSYRFGGGIRGNVLTCSIDHFESTPPENIKVQNYLKGSGGTEPETVDQALDRARRQRKIPTRCISETDIQFLVNKVPGIRVDRTKVLFGYHPVYNTIKMPGAITVVVVPYNRDTNALPIPSKGFINKIKSFLNNFRLICSDITIVAPIYITISVSAQLRIKPKKNQNIIQDIAIQKIDNYLNPILGGPDGEGWPFGRDVYKNDLVALLQKIDGVSGVNNVQIRGANKIPLDKISVPIIGLTASGLHNITIKVEQL
jgi:predicted phage baseplate assembly protein